MPRDPTSEGSRFPNLASCEGQPPVVCISHLALLGTQIKIRLSGDHGVGRRI